MDVCVRPQTDEETMTGSSVHIIHQFGLYVSCLLTLKAMNQYCVMSLLLMIVIVSKCQNDRWIIDLHVLCDCQQIHE